MDKGLKHIAIVAIILAIAAVYATSVRNPTVFDDRGLDDTVHLSTSFPEIPSAGRPLMSWSFAYLYQYTTDIKAHRWVNIALHLVNTLLIYVLTLMLVESVPAALLAAALFGFNPAAVFTVSYLMQRSMLLVTFFGLLQIIFLVEAARSRFRDMIIYLGLATLAYACACSSKEHAAALVVAFPLMVMLYKERSVVWLYAWVITIACAVYAWQFNANFMYEGGYYHDHVKALCDIRDHIWTRSAITQAGLFFDYLWQWVNPFAARAIEMRAPFASWPPDAWSIVGFVGFVGWALTGLILLFRHRVLGFAMLLIWCLHLIEIQTVRLGEMFVLYRSYVYAVGYALMFAAVLNVLKLDRRTLLCAGGCLVLVFGACTVDDLKQFGSPLASWEHAAAILDTASPAHCQAARIYNNYGGELMKVGRNKDALVQLDKSLALGTTFGIAAINAGKACVILRQPERARHYLELVKDSQEDIVRTEAAKGLKLLTEKAGE